MGVERPPGGAQVISGVGTSIAAFLGESVRGRVGAPVRVVSFGEFERVYGGLAPGHELGYAVRQFFGNGGSEAWIVRVAAEPVAARSGLDALEAVQHFNLLALPGVTDAATLAGAAAYCEQRRAMLLVDAPWEGDISQMEAKLREQRLPKSSSAAVYFPYITIADPLDEGRDRLTPPSGTMAGVYARTDMTRGVWKAPAGTAMPLAGATGVEVVLTDVQNGILNPLGVNCLRALPGHGVVSWGARTLRGSDAEPDEYKYVPVKRTALYLEESLSRGLQWAVFEPNAEPLWSRIRLAVGEFLHGLFGRGAFAGRTPREAYFVKCGNDTTTSGDIERGRVNIVVGFAPLRPAEFVIVRLEQIAGQPASG